MRGKKLTQKEREGKIAQDQSERKKIFQELLRHISSGYSMDCFPRLSQHNIKAFLERYPEDFIQEDLDVALRNSKMYWEGIGRRQADGSCLGNSRSWYYNMANRFGWRDKLEIEAEHKGQVSVNIVNYSSPTGS